MPNDNQPTHEIRVRFIKAAIWLNGTDEKPFYNVTFGRIYNANKKRDGKADWKTTDSFGLEDLPLLEKVSARAFSWICQSEERAAAAKRKEAGNEK